MFQMYWITRLDALKDLFFISFVIFGIANVLIGIGLIVDFDNIMGTKPIRKYYPYLILSSFVVSTIWALIPSTKEMAAIIVIPKIVNNKKPQEIPSKILDLSIDWLNKLKPSPSVK